MITGMLLASIGLAGCGKKSEDDITNKEIYQDDLEPLTEEELNEMDADTSDEDMKQSLRKKPLTLQILQMQQKLQIKRKIQIKQKLQILLQKNLRIKLKHQILQIQRNQKLKRKLKNNHKGAVAGIIIATAP